MRNIRGNKKSAKVADEAMFGADQDQGGQEHNHDPAAQGWEVFAIISRIIQIPLAILSCFTHHGSYGVDGMWITGRIRSSEMEHLMVSDGMRRGKARFTDPNMRQGRGRLFHLKFGHIDWKY
ncbi:hypothetical protein Dimus_009746 [Dionaea muscipula]